MNRILLIVEGESKEKGFFDHYEKVRKSQDRLEIVSYRQNILDLYRRCQDYVFGKIKPDNIIDIIKDSNIAQESKQALQGPFTDVYLVFDLDVQNARREEGVPSYLEKVLELAGFFNDSTTIGQLLINYPMMESIYHIKDNQFPSYLEITYPSGVSKSKEYKDYIHQNKLEFDFNKLSLFDFTMLASINLAKANRIVSGDCHLPSFDRYVDSLSQKAILKKQIAYSREHKAFFVLNSSMFVDVDLFGRDLYFQNRGIKFLDEKALALSLSKK